MVESVNQVAKDPDAVAAVPADDVTPQVRALTVDGEDPLTAGDDFVLTRPSDAEPGAVVTTTVVGDIMLGRRVGDLLERRDDPAAVFRPLAKRLASSDITVGNLESTLSTAGPATQGGDSFGADDSVLEGLKLAGFDLLSLANNHLGDFGRTAIVETVQKLDSAGFRTVGGGVDRAQAAKPAVITVGDVRVGFVATDSIGETPAAGRNSPGTNRINAPPRTGPLDRKALDRVAESVRRLDADVVIALTHWGTQYTNEPERSQRRIARALVDAGADVVVGGHPHWVQGWESIRGRHGGALAGQLRLRHGLHARDPGRDLRRDREPRRQRGGREAGAVRHRRPVHPAPGGREPGQRHLRPHPGDQRATVRRTSSVSQPSGCNQAVMIAPTRSS